MLDADLRDFFGSLEHAQLIRFVEHRIGDKRVVRLIRLWLAAGVLEDGAWTPSETGTPQGGSISPLAANLRHLAALDGPQSRVDGVVANDLDLVGLARRGDGLQRAESIWSFEAKIPPRSG